MLQGVLHLHSPPGGHVLVGQQPDTHAQLQSETYFHLLCSLEYPETLCISLMLMMAHIFICDYLHRIYDYLYMWYMIICICDIWLSVYDICDICDMWYMIICICDIWLSVYVIYDYLYMWYMIICICDIWLSVYVIYDYLYMKNGYLNMIYDYQYMIYDYLYVIYDYLYMIYDHRRFIVVALKFLFISLNKSRESFMVHVREFMLSVDPLDLCPSDELNELVTGMLRLLEKYYSNDLKKVDWVVNNYVIII